MKIATPGSAEEFMRGVNKRLRQMERRGGSVAGVSVESTVVDDEVVITYAPVIPSQPITEQKVGAIAVTWNGMGEGDEQMPPNFAAVDVHRSQESSEFEPDEYTLVGTLTGPGTLAFTDQPYDEIFYYRFIMRNRDGLSSAPSIAAAAVASRVGGTDLTADSIDGKLITGATIQTGTTGGRAVLRPGASTALGVGTHVVELHSGNVSEAVPAELISLADGADPTDNISVLFLAPQKSGYLTQQRSSLQMFAKDADTFGFASLAAEAMRVYGQYQWHMQTAINSSTSRQALISGNVTDNSGDCAIWTSVGIECRDGGWVDVPSSAYATGWSDYIAGDPYWPGWRWRYTHDDHVEVQFALRTTAPATTNPFVLDADHGMPLPNIRFGEGWCRDLISTGYQVLPILIYPNTAGAGANAGRVQMMCPTSSTHTVIAGNFKYRYRQN